MFCASRGIFQLGTACEDPSLWEYPEQSEGSQWAEAGGNTPISHACSGHGCAVVCCFVFDSSLRKAGAQQLFGTAPDTGTSVRVLP